MINKTMDSDMIWGFLGKFNPFSPIIGLFVVVFIINVECLGMEVFRFPEEIDGFKLIQAEPERYTPESLFDYIDGNAEVYRALGVKEVWVYKWHNASGIEIILDIFDMGNSNGAYGAFHHDIRDQEDVGIGIESELMSNSLAFWKGKYFVSIVAMDTSEEIKRVILQLGKAVESQIEEKGEIPRIVSLLPEKGLKRSHIHYFRTYDLFKVHYHLAEENILGLTTETEGILARYSLKEVAESFVMVLIKYPREEEAVLRIKEVNSYFERLTHSPEEQKKDRLKSVLTSQKGRYLFIIVDWKDERTARKYLQEMVDRIE